eukprot:CAMPEP_0175186162 /NCGR_PEP_ID=MMETSP0093-20121207/2247_1 /TAXON_ID=311494 /ORGANISM="Alexandrium monilatum, Strain CCMP3105" /LENGTH=63 /DNA_ID=CAMNT_0016478871 /DNA_START=1 /DNA_END=192 /DNA_ORIENTATION=+
MCMCKPGSLMPRRCKAGVCSYCTSWQTANGAQTSPTAYRPPTSDTPLVGRPACQDLGNSFPLY